MALEADFVNRALQLALEDRAELVHQLILSMETPEFDADADTKWEAEVERRAAAVDRGEVKLVDWRDAIDRARQAIRR